MSVIRVEKADTGPAARPSAQERMRNVFSVDLEDWYHLEGIHFTEWHRYESRVQGSTERLLELLSDYGVRATFFVLGKLAERYPELVRTVARQHEVATHGHDHEFVDRQRPEDFREQLKRSIGVLEDVTGHRVLGHRAPFFSVTKQSFWALEVIADCGLIYDSSIFPMLYRFYGTSVDRFPNVQTLPSGRRLLELPLATFRRGGVNWPIAGGFFLRLYPARVIPWAIRKLNDQGQRVIVYTHPWELDSEQPVIHLPWRVGFRHYFNLHSTEKRLRLLLSQSRFASVREVFASELEQTARE